MIQTWHTGWVYGTVVHDTDMALQGGCGTVVHDTDMAYRVGVWYSSTWYRHGIQGGCMEQ